VQLSSEEARVLGCLLEKQRTTPDVYPLSVNAVITACNQSTNRAPVVCYGEETAQQALDALRERGLARRGVYPGSRVIKHRHALDEELHLDERDLAVLCVLLLRGAQTPGELKSRTERLYRFEDLAAIEESIERLAGRDEPLVRRLRRDPGQKEARVATLLRPDADELAPDPIAHTPVRDVRPPSLLETRVAVLEQQVAGLRAEVERLRDANGG
jgi:uncharacterized protein YceH (UPF0502 family)